MTNDECQNIQDKLDSGVTINLTGAQFQAFWRWSQQNGRTPGWLCVTYGDRYVLTSKKGPPNPEARHDTST
jgi:hypothetical protein